MDEQTPLRRVYGRTLCPAGCGAHITTLYFTDAYGNQATHYECVACDWQCCAAKPAPALEQPRAA